jgi:hypothetical protein
LHVSTVYALLQIPVGPRHHHGQAVGEHEEFDAELDALLAGLTGMEQVADELRLRAAQGAGGPGPRARALRAAARVVRREASMPHPCS